MNVPVTISTTASDAVVWPSDATALMTLCRELSKARTLPNWCAQSPADLFFAVQSLLRAKLDPFMSLRHISAIREGLFFDGQLCNAILNNSEKLATNVSYEFNGEGEELTVTVRARLVNEAQPREMVVRYADVKNPKNENWKNNPRQQLGYRAVRDWARRNCPEVLMGFRFKEEQDDMIDVTPKKADAPTLKQEEHAPPPDTEEKTTSETVSDSEAQPFEIPRTDGWGAWGNTFIAYVRAASTAELINEWQVLNVEQLGAMASEDKPKFEKLKAICDHQLALRVEKEER